MGIVHDGHLPGLPMGAGDVVVGQADGVAHLVSRELPDPGQRHLRHLGGVLVSHLVGRGETLAQEVVLPDPEGAQSHVPLQDLTGSRVRYRVPIAPPSRGAVDPLDHVVAQVHGVRVFREDLDPEAVYEARRLVGLVPPAGSLQERGADGLGCARVHVVDDGLHRLAHGRRRVLLLDAVPGDVAPGQGLTQGHGVVHVGDAIESGPWISLSSHVTVVGELHEGVVLPHRHGVSGWRHASDVGSRGVGGEGERELHLRVLREGLGPGQVHGAPGGVQPKGALVGSCQRRDHTHGVANEEGGGVHQHTTFGLRRHLESEEHRGWEAVLHRLPLRRAGGFGSIGVVLL